MITAWLMGERRRCRPCGHTRLVLKRRGRNLPLLRHRLFRSGLWSTYYSIESTDSLLLRRALIVLRRVFYQIGKLLIAFRALLFGHGPWLVGKLWDLHWSQFWIGRRLWQVVVGYRMLESWVSFCCDLIITKRWLWVLTCAEESKRRLAAARIMF